MKEIKFRVWDKKDKVFLEPAVCAINMEGALLIDILYRGDNKLEGTWLYDDEEGNYEISFYTGLKDKNGKEIYEGDVVKLYRPEGEEIGVVEFGDGAFYVSLPLSEDGEEREAVPFFWTEDDIEIIGNIYENPELSEIS